MKKNLNLKIILTTLAVSFVFSFIPLNYLGAQINPLQNDILTNQDTAFREAAGYQSATRLTLSQMIASVIKIVLSLLGIIFIILIIYAGMLWLTSAGNEDRISKAKSIMISAVIGLIIVLSAYAITHFVISRIINATIGDGSGYGNGGSDVTPPVD